MEGFNSYGGSGWECLNEYNVLDSTTGEIEYLTNKTKFEITKENCITTDNKYKLVIVFENGDTLEAETNIINYGANFTLSIDSDEGNNFYYGMGTPTLTLMINDYEGSSNYLYK